MGPRGGTYLHPVPQGQGHIPLLLPVAGTHDVGCKSATRRVILVVPHAMRLAVPGIHWPGRPLQLWPWLLGGAVLPPAVEGVAAFPAAEHTAPAAEEAKGPADATPAGARISAERCARAREEPVEQASAVALLGLLPLQGSQVGQRLVAPLVRHDYLVDAECPLVSPLKGHGMSAGGRGRYTTAHTLPPMPVTPHICHPGCHDRKRGTVYTASLVRFSWMFNCTCNERNFFFSIVCSHGWTMPS